MRVGFTYDLKDDYLNKGYSLEDAAEFDEGYTIDAIEKAMMTLGHDVVRIGGFDPLIKRLMDGERWDLVFNIAEGSRGLSREAQVPAVLDSYGIPHTFSSSVVLAVTHHKGFTKMILRQAGLPTPDFKVVSEIDDLESIDLAFPLFAKPIAEGTGKGVTENSRISSKDQLEPVVKELLERFSQPVLVEEYLPGMELTVGVLGTGRNARAIGAMEVKYLIEGDFYSISTKKNYVGRVTYSLAQDSIAEECCKLALDAHRVLGCRDASRSDIRLDAHGRPSFIEINALPGLNPIESDIVILAGFVGMTHQQIIGDILSSAFERIS